MPPTSEKEHAKCQPVHITVIGAGFMGCVIATIYARYGFDVVLHDAVPGMLGSFVERALPIAHSLRTSEITPEEIVGRVRLVVALDVAVAQAELVHEVIQEDLSLKQDLFKKLDHLCPPSVVLASNTSSFLLSHLCRDVVHKERVVGIHYITPAHIVQAVEIIVADFTPPELIVWTRAFVARIDHVPVVCREKPGFLINRMQFALMAEMHRIVDEGLASAEDVDNAIRLSLGPRWALWGGLACEDLVASKRTAVAMLEYMHSQTGQPQYETTDTLRRLVSENKLGAATGEGWFEWRRPNAELVMERDRQLAEILAWLAARKSMAHLQGPG
jgi:3-hydroxybutyryl-CoA dehydrogenase